MVKFAKPDEKPFDPISDKLLSAIANPTRQEEEPSPAPPESDDAAAEPGREPEKTTPERSRRAASRRPALKGLAKQSAKPERLDRTVKCLFTPSEDRELRAMVARLATEAGTKLTLSHLMRPYFDLLLHCEGQLSEELRRAEVSRPVNDQTALARFERQLAEVIHSALRKAPLLRAERHDAED